MEAAANRPAIPKAAAWRNAAKAAAGRAAGAGPRVGWVSVVGAVGYADVAVPGTLAAEGEEGDEGGGELGSEAGCQGAARCAVYSHQVTRKLRGRLRLRPHSAPSTHTR